MDCEGVNVVCILCRESTSGAGIGYLQVGSGMVESSRVCVKRGKRSGCAESGLWRIVFARTLKKAWGREIGRKNFMCC